MIIIWVFYEHIWEFKDKIIFPYIYFIYIYFFFFYGVLFFSYLVYKTKYYAW